MALGYIIYNKPAYPKFLPKLSTGTICYTQFMGSVSKNKIFLKYTTLLFIVLIITGGVLVGGIVGSVLPCINGKLIFVGPPTPGRFMVVPGSIVYPFRSLRSGAWVLGLASPGGSCVTPDAPPKIIPAKGTVIMIGTSP